MSRPIGVIGIVLFAAAVVILCSTSASAWCVYNYTDKTLTIRNGFSPGDFYQEVKPGAENHKCCPADARGCGKPEIYVLASSFSPDESFLKGLYRASDCALIFTKQYYWFHRLRKGAGVPEAYVPPHGWISIDARMQDGVRTPYGVIKDEHGKIVWQGFARTICGEID